MISSQMKESLSRGFGAPSSIDFAIAREFALIVGVAATLYATYSIGFTNGWRAHLLETHPTYADSLSWPHTYNSLRVVIAIAFIVCSRSLKSRTVLGFALSTAALLVAIGCYSQWYYYSVQLLWALEITNFSQSPDLGIPHVGGFITATGWDMIPLVALCVLLVWKVFLLLKMLRLVRQA